MKAGGRLRRRGKYEGGRRGRNGPERNESVVPLRPKLLGKTVGKGRLGSERRGEGAGGGKCVGLGGGAKTNTGGPGGGTRLEGDGVLVAGDVGEIEGFLGFFASEFCPVVTKVYKKEVVVGAA